MPDYCRLASTAAGAECPVCGYRLKRDYAAMPRVVCRGKRRPTPKPTPAPLGDRLAAALAWCGVTKTRYKRWKQLVGLSPECGCDRRQSQLNRLGQQCQAWLNRVSRWWRGEG